MGAMVRVGQLERVAGDIGDVTRVASFPICPIVA